MSRWTCWDLYLGSCVTVPSLFVADKVTVPSEVFTPDTVTLDKVSSVWLTVP